MLQVFHLFLTYIASVLFGCYKSRSGVAYVTTGPTCCSCWGAAERAQTVLTCGRAAQAMSVRSGHPHGCEKQDVGVGVRPDVRALAIPFLLVVLLSACVVGGGSRKKVEFVKVGLKMGLEHIRMWTPQYG
jgi:hypothetical protein